MYALVRIARMSEARVRRKHALARANAVLARSAQAGGMGFA
jgi:hypothetical protein